jgi:pteridine reductase
VSTTTATLHGKWALITGAGKRIGAVIASELHAAGCNVIVHYYRSSDAADTLVATLNGARADSAFAVGADLRDSAKLAPLIETAASRAGRLDVLVNNASSFYATALGEITEDDWNDLIDSNLKAPLFLSQAALPHLRKAKGCIVNMVDIHARRPLRNFPVYGAAKAGLAMLTRSLAKDLAPEIRVNGVAPGAILWPEDGMSESVKQNIIGKIPLARAGEPADVAAAVLFLVRDAAYVTGQIIAVDGGRSVGW